MHCESSRHALPSIYMTGNSAGLRGYRVVVRLPGWGWWATTALSSRVPDAMAPLALVLLGHSATGSFVVGGLASGAHALCEAVAAPLLGAWADRATGPGRLRLMLAVRTIGYVLIVGLGAILPAVALVSLAGLAGSAGAGVQGSLRASLGRLTDADTQQQAYSLDTVLVEVAWTVAPVLVTALGALGDPRLAVAAMALSTGTSALVAGRLPASASGTTAVRSSGAGLRSAAATLFLGLVAGSVGGALDTATPPRLADLHVDPGLAGILFTGYSITSVIGGLAYGWRRWPGNPHRQAAVLLIGLPLALLPAAALPSFPVLAAATMLAGLLAAPLITTRSLALQDRLPAHQWGAGFAALYAVNGAGYGVASLLVSGLLPAGATIAYAVPLVTAISVGTATLLLGIRSRG